MDSCVGEGRQGPLVGVVTVLFGGDEVVDGFFAGLAAQRGVRFRVYVVDNNPTPAMSEHCRELAAGHGITVDCVFPGANVGVARGNNLGIGLALRDGCDRVLLANNDTLFAAGTLARLAEAIAAGEAVVTPKILFPGRDRRIWFAAGAPDAWTRPTRHIGIGEPDRGQFNGVTHTEFAPTTFLMLDSSVFSRVGMMDEAYFAYYDDTDFARRVRAAGIRIGCVSDAEVVHLVGASTGGSTSPFTVFHGHRNRIYFMRKHFTGIERAVGLGYFLLSRLPKTLRTPRRLIRPMWAGVWAGLRLPLPTPDPR